MSDNGDKGIKEDIPPIIQMVLTFNPVNGQVQVSGPIHNRTLCYGILEMAKDAIYEFKEKSKLVEKPKGDLINFLRQRR